MGVENFEDKNKAIEKEERRLFKIYKGTEEMRK